MENVLDMQPAEVTKLVSCEDGNTWFLDYYLRTYKSTDNKELYGIKVCKRKTNTDRILEHEETYAISECCDKVMEILMYLAEGTVTPIVLLEMVDDWFSSETWSQIDDTTQSPPLRPNGHTYRKEE